MPLLFAITLFVSATLLFLVQPMIAKMVLPLLGGTPAVWNTCMVFFQATLLAGYAYAHATTSWLGVRRQVLVHTVALFLPLVALPIRVAGDWAPSGEANPIPWLLGLLLVSVGLPFFVLATSAPLLQKWFGFTGHPSGKDPYFLYAASNLGSMLALLSYPAMIEPFLPLKATALLSQSWLWAVGYGVFSALVLCCAWAVWRSVPGAKKAESERAAAQGSKTPSEWAAVPGPGMLRRLHWVALAFVPSSLMLGVTTHISLDIAAIPLFWVVPLSLYLLSFILVFAKWGPRLHVGMVLVTPVIILLLVFTMHSGLFSGIRLTIAMHLLTLFAVAMVCHGQLARTRPSTQHLTEFYLLMSVGGVLGGVFNALVAPLVFDSVVEYPLALVLACLLLPNLNPGIPTWLSRWVPKLFAQPAALIVDLILAGLLGILSFYFLLFVYIDALPLGPLVRVRESLRLGIDRISEHIRLGDYLYFEPWQWTGLLAFGLPVLLCYLCVARPLRFALAVGAILLVCAGWESLNKHGRVLHQERSFFGVLKVEVSRDEEFIRLNHGTTLHGMQSRDPQLALQPLTYFHVTGPIGQVFIALADSLAKRDIAVIGLGSGTLACYGQPGQTIIFFDIDPAVVRIAKNTRFFTNLANCRARYRIVLGDARLRLEKVDNRRFQLLVVDAFNSDAIPIHLLTREALELYFQKLTADGVLAVHISNRYLNLEPVLGNLAADLGLVGLYQFDQDPANHVGKAASQWVVLAGRRDALGSLAEDKRWQPIQTRQDTGVWTDDFSNLLRVFDPGR